MSLVIRQLEEADLPEVASWFADQETRRWLGDEAWPRRLLQLAAPSAGRFAFAALLDSALAGVADVDRYDDGLKRELG